MKETVFEMIEALVSIMSVSGHEEQGRDALCALTEPYFDEYIPDPSGTHVFVKRCGKENAKKLMLDAHFDEIGFLVSEILDGGFLRISPVGGHDARILPAAEVKIYGKKTLYGVIAATPPHLQKPGDYKKVQKVSDLLVDTGYDKEELETLVSIGTPIGFFNGPTRLLDGRIVSRSLDNKACCTAAILAATMVQHSEMACDLYVTLSAKEEAGMASPCSAAAYRIAPDAAIVTDVGFAAAPGVRDDVSGKMGGGPVISLSAVTDRKLTRRLIDLCGETEIPVQTCVDGADTGTNATLLSLTGAGIPTAVVSVPLTSMHTYSEAVDAADIESTAALFAAAIRDGGIY